MNQNPNWTKYEWAKGSEFYNRSMKSWLEKNGIAINSTRNEGKSVIAERFIKTLKNKIYKYTTSVSKNVCINNLYDIINKYNDTYQNTIKMNVNVNVNVKQNTYIESSKEILNLKLVILLEYQNIKIFLQ